jgi:two-component system sensor histidine kinase UhpB
VLFAWVVPPISGAAVRALLPGTRGMGDPAEVDVLRRLPLYWQICLINGAVLAAGTAVLAFSPATVSSSVLASEMVVLALGLAVMLVLNAVLLRHSLAPLDRLVRTMAAVDLTAPGQREPAAGSGSVARIVTGFNQMLDRLELERGRSNAMALAAQEAERHRVAQELHDEVGQGLTAVLLGLSRIADDAPPELLEEVRLAQDTARATLAEVGEVARRLRPGVLDDLGLLSALAALTTDLAARTHVNVTRGFAPGLPRLSTDAELVVYRVAQEALTNAARHSGARTVDVRLGRQGHGVLLRVGDDGRGLRGPEGNGIRGMRERALLVDATIEIGPRIGGGTEVRLLVPAQSS